MIWCENVWAEFMPPREVGESEIRLCIWGGLLTTALYTWNKYAYFRDPIWLYMTTQCGGYLGGPVDVSARHFELSVKFKGGERVLY